MGKWQGGEETKPNWDDYYMALALTVAQRSVDKSTVHGACLVSYDHRLLSIGYNGPLKGGTFSDEDLSKRPDKYWYMIHAEENCLINYHGSYSDLGSSTIYVTGEPCHRCLRMILQKGIHRIVYGTIGSKCIDENDIKAKKKMIAAMAPPPQIIVYNNLDNTKELLQKTLDYIEYKENQ